MMYVINDDVFANGMHLVTIGQIASGTTDCRHCCQFIYTVKQSRHILVDLKCAKILKCVLRNVFQIVAGVLGDDQIKHR